MRAPSNYIFLENTCSDFSEELFVVGGRLRAPFNYIFPVNTSVIGGRRTGAKGAFGSQGGAMAQCPSPCLRPWFSRKWQITAYMRLLLAGIAIGQLGHCVSTIRQGRKQGGALGHDPPLAPKAPFAIVRLPPIANVLQGKCSWMAPSGALKRQKVPAESPSRGFSGLIRRPPGSNDENFLRKVPPMTTIGRPPWVKWRPPSPCPPFAIF